MDADTLDAMNTERPDGGLHTPSALPSRAAATRSLQDLQSPEFAIESNDLAGQDLRSLAKSAMLSGGMQRNQDQMGGFCAGQQSILQ